jgi:ribosomal small subunit protein bTHX
LVIAAAHLAKRLAFKEYDMGKGDLRSRKGKIYRGTTGKTRPQNGKPRNHVAEAKSTH